MAKFCSHDHIDSIIWVTEDNFAGEIKNMDYDNITFISKYLNFKKAWSGDFADIIKTGTILLKQPFKTQKKFWLLAFPIREQSQKGQSWIGLKSSLNFVL